MILHHADFGLSWTTPRPDEKNPFLKFFFREIQKFVWKTNPFPRQAISKNRFVLTSHYTGDSPYRVWFDLNNSLTRWRRPIFKNPFSRNSKDPEWNTNFFPRQVVPKILLALHCHYTGDTQYRVWFDLGNSLTRWKTTIFKILKNSQFAKFVKFRMKNHFFPWQATPTTFLLYTLVTLVILDTGLVWIEQLLEPMKKTYF